MKKLLLMLCTLLTPAYLLSMTQGEPLGFFKRCCFGFCPCCKGMGPWCWCGIATVIVAVVLILLLIRFIRKK